ncbi:response regulator [Mongoliitalea daihaiensis]|uniref:response regulator n=1 Tax=Mongoliitalea daihaiensis TaxID=2782006 RepID=UPI001F3FE6BA|nr:response regulator [Mongoliitalea daihaiensis]UJP63431.1 response regulator [Mongoliitalea daihaiensis]
MIIDTIILVDDDPLAILISKSLLQKSEVLNEGIQLHTFTKPQAALEYMQTFASVPNRSAVVLLDINMPVMDGFQLLAALEKSNTSAAFKVIMLTSSISLQDKERAESFPSVVDYFSKPLDFNKIDFIRSLLKAG